MRDLACAGGPKSAAFRSTGGTDPRTTSRKVQQSRQHGALNVVFRLIAPETERHSLFVKRHRTEMQRTRTAADARRAGTQTGTTRGPSSSWAWRAGCSTRGSSSASSGSSWQSLPNGSSRPTSASRARCQRARLHARTPSSCKRSAGESRSGGAHRGQVVGGIGPNGKVMAWCASPLASPPSPCWPPSSSSAPRAAAVTPLRRAGFSPSLSTSARPSAGCAPARPERRSHPDVPLYILYG